jgi:AcrR family transcriptional regulator
MPASRRDDLIEAAMRVFAREGFLHTSLDAVLREKNISRMTLYNHFKSKDELILAALQRRDEQFFAALLNFVEAHASDPIGRVLATFDYFDTWFTSEEFTGCMFINASAEFADPHCPVRALVARHKLDILRYLVRQLEAAGLPDAQTLGRQILILQEGAITVSKLLGLVSGNDIDAAQPARLARQAAGQLIDAAQRAD